MVYWTITRKSNNADTSGYINCYNEYHRGEIRVTDGGVLLLKRGNEVVGLIRTWEDAHLTTLPEFRVAFGSWKYGCVAALGHEQLRDDAVVEFVKTLQEKYDGRLDKLAAAVTEEVETEEERYWLLDCFDDFEGETLYQFIKHLDEDCDDAGAELLEFILK